MNYCYTVLILVLLQQPKVILKKGKAQKFGDMNMISAVDKFLGNGERLNKALLVSQHSHFS